MPTFLDYIQGGTALNFSVAVDFTGSNGHPLDPDSLHFLSANGVNEYTQAIQAVGEIIEPYDADRQFPALGFGAKMPHSGEISFEFFLNMSASPFCYGIPGILEAYRVSNTSPDTLLSAVFSVLRRFSANCDNISESLLHSKLRLET